MESRMIYLPLLLFNLAFIICSEFYLFFAMEVKLPSFSLNIGSNHSSPEEAFWESLLASAGVSFCLCVFEQKSSALPLTLNIQLFSRVFYISFAGWEASPREEISLVFNFGWGYAVMPHKCTPAYRSTRQRDPWSPTWSLMKGSSEDISPTCPSVSVAGWKKGPPFSHLGYWYSFHKLFAVLY